MIKVTIDGEEWIVTTMETTQRVIESPSGKTVVQYFGGMKMRVLIVKYEIVGMRHNGKDGQYWINESPGLKYISAEEYVSVEKEA
jgi:hypothetical protein